MQKTLLTLKREGSSILEEAAGAGRAIAAAESLRPLPMVEILQDIRLLAPQRELGQQMPQVGSGDLTAQKNKRRQERDRRYWKAGDLDFGHVFRGSPLPSFGRAALDVQPL